MITNEDIAYIAGLFDGEGSIYFARRKEKKKKHNHSESTPYHSRKWTKLFLHSFHCSSLSAAALRAL